MSPFPHDSDVSRFVKLGFITETELHSLLSKATRVHYPKETYIIRQGMVVEDQDHMIYILKSGTAKVVYTQLDNTTITLAEITAGALIGEHLLFYEGDARSRSASIIATDSTELFQIPLSVFQEFVQERASLYEYIRQRTHKHTIENLQHRSKVFSLLSAGKDLHSITFVQHPANTIIFHKGDVGTTVYLIVKGTAEVFDPDNNHILTQLGEGQLFGERALLTQDTRSASVRSKENIELLELSAENFYSMYNRSSNFRKILSDIDFINRLPGGNSLTFPSEYHGYPSINRMYNLGNDRHVISSWVPDLETYHIQQNNVSIAHTYTWKNASQNLERVLAFTIEKHIAQATISGKWMDTPWIIEAILENRVFTDADIDKFTQIGRLTRPIERDLRNSIICKCLQIDKQSIQQCIENGCRNRAEIQEKTGCGLVCGGCVPTIEGLLGETEWIPIQITRTMESDSVYTYTLIPDLNIEIHWQTGQHVVLSGHVDGMWIERSYTITAPPSAQHITISVKREHHGIFSRWLADGAVDVKELRMSTPRGEIVWNPSRSICCLVAGIGVTPALAIMRSSIELSTESIAPVIIHYSHRSGEGICMHEMENINASYEHITIETKVTNLEGHVTKEDIASYITDDDREYLICGPESYIKHITNTLSDFGIPKERILIESFGSKKPQTSVPNTNLLTRSSFIQHSYLLGSIAILVFICTHWLYNDTPFSTMGNTIRGHEQLHCADCHEESPGTVRQQIQAKIQFWLGNRGDIAWQHSPINNKTCTDCHDQSDNVHASHLFLESKYEAQRAEFAPEQCVSCHQEHRNNRVNIQSMTFCSECHNDMQLETDSLKPPSSPTHDELVQANDWSSCLGCHDYHGNHIRETPIMYSERIPIQDIRTYIHNGNAIYGTNTLHPATTNKGQ